MPICLPELLDLEEGIPDDKKYGRVEIAGMWKTTKWYKTFPLHLWFYKKSYLLQLFGN